MYLHDANVRAEVWEALDTEKRRAEREESSPSIVCCFLVGEEGNCTCLAHLFGHITDIILTCELLENPEETLSTETI